MVKIHSLVFFRPFKKTTEHFGGNNFNDFLGEWFPLGNVV